MKNLNLWIWAFIGLTAIIEAVGVATGHKELSMPRQIGSDVMIMLQSGLLCVLYYYDKK